MIRCIRLYRVTPRRLPYTCPYSLFFFLFLVSTIFSFFSLYFSFFFCSSCYLDRFEVCTCTYDIYVCTRGHRTMNWVSKARDSHSLVFNHLCYHRHCHFHLTINPATVFGFLCHDCFLVATNVLSKTRQMAVAPLPYNIELHSRLDLKR